MRAKPLVIWGLLGGVFTLPATTLALGLGKLTVDSNLGQPLSAHVELTAAQKDEIDSLSAKIADPSVYRDNNVQYPAVLSRARVVVERSANGPPQLKVTTSQSVNEPYLDLIVEVDWATGRVVRNYTFLLDPPGMAQAQTVAPPAVVRAEGRSQEVLEQYLEKKRIRRRAVLETPHFMSLPFILARTDLIATVPHAIGFAYVSEHASITLVEPPLPLPRFDLRQHWHRKFHNDPRAGWLRGVVAELFNDAKDEWPK